jgi:hypothetical protein
VGCVASELPLISPSFWQTGAGERRRCSLRPRKPTADEARAAALEELVPKAITVLREHLESGRPDAWRPALKVLEHAWGRPPGQVEASVDVDGFDLTRLTLEELSEMRNRVLSEHPELAQFASPST